MICPAASVIPYVSSTETPVCVANPRSTLAASGAEADRANRIPATSAGAGCSISAARIAGTALSQVGDHSATRAQYSPGSNRRSSTSDEPLTTVASNPITCAFTWNSGSGVYPR